MVTLSRYYHIPYHVMSLNILLLLYYMLRVLACKLLKISFILVLAILWEFSLVSRNLCEDTCTLLYRVTVSTMVFVPTH